MGWGRQPLLARGIGTMMPSCPKGSIPAKLLSYQVGEEVDILPVGPRSGLTSCHIAQIKRHKELGFHGLAFKLGG